MSPPSTPDPALLAHRIEAVAHDLDLTAESSRLDFTGVVWTSLAREGIDERLAAHHRALTEAVRALRGAADVYRAADPDLWVL